MHTGKIFASLGLAILLAAGRACFAAESEETKATSSEKAFIMKAANGGMTEVEMGKLAAEKGGSDAVKDFGNRMVKDHSKANDQLKDVAAKIGVAVPGKVNAKHQAMIDKMSAMSGPAFDKAYVKEMVNDHKKTIAELETAGKEVKNADLKKFIDDTVPVIKDHLDMIQKFDQAKQ
jgi:putative membrane protein